MNLSYFLEYFNKEVGPILKYFLNPNLPPTSSGEGENAPDEVIKKQSEVQIAK